jgi:putative transposase
MEHWPHAPLHWLYAPGIYIVTGATLHKENYFTEPRKLDLVQSKLLETAQRYEWNLEAWSILTNHYHFIARSPGDANTLRGLIRDFHSGVSREINRMDGVAGRKVLYQFRDEMITTERSYLARLKYVHGNAVHHRIVENASNYRWCSASWFERTASRSFVKTVYGFKIDYLRVFEP